MNKNKLCKAICVIVALVLLGSLIAVICVNKRTQAELKAESARVAKLTDEKEAAVTLAAETQAKLDALTVVADPAAEDTFTLEDIAAFNGCEAKELNVTYDEEGRVTFIGSPFTEKKVLMEADAAEVLGTVIDLISFDDVSLTYYDCSESKTTGDHYFSFYQTEEIEVEPGLTVLFDNKSACAKVITDAEGNVLGLSSCVGNRAPDKGYTSEQIVSSEAAEADIVERLRKYDPDAKVFPELTQPVYLYDEAAIELAGLESKRMPAWLIVSDLEVMSGKQGTAFLVSMVRIPKEKYAMLDMSPDDDDVAVAQMVPLTAPDAASLEEVFDTYTSLIYFDGLTDGGTFTYTLNEADWVRDARSGYEFQTRTVTVPVMYNGAENEYVLGDLENKILVADYHSYYILRNPVPNVLVTETPEDPASWHFKRPVITEKDGSETTLFLNTTYALSTYDTLLSVSKNYADTLGVHSYDGNGMPGLLLLNIHEGQAYPKNENSFMMNACNIGAMNDFAVMATSPILSVAEDEMVIGHEYAHGIDAFNSALLYMNVTGAVEEAFADAFGMSLYNAVHGTDIIDLGSLNPYGTLRSIGDPEQHAQPRYYNGRFYSPVVDSDDMVLLQTVDMGGVHTNSGVTNYLTYSLSPANGKIEGTPLAWEEILKLFYEASFCRTAEYDYDEIGAYMRFAAERIGLDAPKKATLALYLRKLGFSADKSIIELLVDGQGLETVTVRADVSEAGDSVVAVSGMNVSSMTAASSWGMLGETPRRIFMGRQDLGRSFWQILSDYQGKTIILATSLNDSDKLGSDILVKVKTLRLSKGETYDFGEPISFFNLDGTGVFVEGEPTKLYFPYAAEVLVGGQSSEQGVTLYHVITGTPEEIAADLSVIQAKLEADMDAFMKEYEETEDEQPAA